MTDDGCINLIPRKTPVIVPRNSFDIPVQFFRSTTLFTFLKRRCG
jgi:hypothetical protein